MRVPLANGDYAILARPFGSTVLPMTVAPFIDMLRQMLMEKFPDNAAHEAQPAAASLRGTESPSGYAG